MSTPALIELAAFKEHRLALAFSDYLRSLGIGNHIEVEPDRFAVILAREEDLDRARQELEGFLRNPGDARYWQASWHSGQVIRGRIDNGGVGVGDVLQNLWQRSGPLTLLISVLSIFAYVGLLADARAVFSWLRYPVDVRATHEYWRLITPVFMHFGLVHLLFNLVWWWDLGGLIERTQSRLQLLGVFLATALLSNFAQYVIDGSDFGGLSGVVYGLLGYIWLYPLVNPRVGFRLNPLIALVMIGWLLVGYSGVLDQVIGPMANSAHLYGLLTGVVLGIAFGVLHGSMAKDEAGED